MHDQRCPARLGQRGLHRGPPLAPRPAAPCARAASSARSPPELSLQATSGGGASDASASTDAADGEGEEGLAAAFAEDLTLSVKEGTPTTLTASQVKGMTPMELAKYYKVGGGGGWWVVGGGCKGG